MTDKYIQQKFSELIYELGECNFNAITTEFWNKYINYNEPFNQEQLEIFKYFAEDIIQNELKELTKRYIK